jgi:hypothetical protein
MHTLYILTFSIGLQTPRLKRLAEIVSAQAMAQQETQLENGQPLNGGISDVEPI